MIFSSQCSSSFIPFDMQFTPILFKTFRYLLATYMRYHYSYTFANWYQKASMLEYTIASTLLFQRFFSSPFGELLRFHSTCSFLWYVCILPERITISHFKNSSCDFVIKENPYILLETLGFSWLIGGKKALLLNRLYFCAIFERDFTFRTSD